MSASNPIQQRSDCRCVGEASAVIPRSSMSQMGVNDDGELESSDNHYRCLPGVLSWGFVCPGVEVKDHTL